MDAVQYKCPACGAGLKFDAKTQDFKCEYCDSVFKEEDFINKIFIVETGEKGALTEKSAIKVGKHENEKIKYHFNHYHINFCLCFYV